MYINNGIQNPSHQWSVPRRFGSAASGHRNEAEALDKISGRVLLDGP